MTNAITDAIAEADDTDGRISFEVTEHAALASIQIAERFSDDMRLLGCRLALDDFGTGFGTFTDLRRLALHSLKIDISFVRGLPENRRDESVVKMIIHIAKEVGLVTTAEGVGDAATLARLIELGADQVQGYLIARPALATTS
jgi:EAL domain-containing protein (putative c-di-GMP-specific phosphodiesterase class I)